MAAPTVKEMLDELIRIEGGYVDDETDRGGATKYGISLRYAKTVGDHDGDGYQDFDLDKDGDVDKDDIKLIKREDAERAYIRDFLVGPNFDKLPEAIVPVVFDIGVNSGPSRGAMILQRVINLAGFGPIAVDGKVGPTTIRKAIAAYREMGPFLVNAIVDERINWYNEICRRDPNQKKFLKGWIRRANLFRVPV